MSGGFSARDATIYRPYPDAIPWELLYEADPDEERVASYAELDLMRVAKYHDEVIAAYVIREVGPARFELCNLVVQAEFRHKGLGRWLLGHAIGLAETIGAREILLRDKAPGELFTRVGFRPCDEGALLTLMPE